MLITQECFSMAGLFSIYSLNTHKKEKKDWLVGLSIGAINYLHVYVDAFFSYTNFITFT